MEERERERDVPAAVHVRDPIIAPPVMERGWEESAKNEKVCAVNEDVRENARHDCVPWPSHT